MDGDTTPGQSDVKLAACRLKEARAAAKAAAAGAKQKAKEEEKLAACRLKEARAAEKATKAKGKEEAAAAKARAKEEAPATKAARTSADAAHQVRSFPFYSFVWRFALQFLFMQPSKP